MIGRASDIWSFGCIILEILTHLKYKAEGLVRFRKLRKAKITKWGYTVYQFHDFGRTSFAVQDWITRLQAEIPPVWVDTLLLAKDMTRLDPEYRPKAREVTSRLFLESQRVVFNAIMRLMDSFRQQSQALEISIEHQKLVLWGWSANLVDASSYGLQAESVKGVFRTWLIDDISHYEDISEALVDLTHELRALEEVIHGKQPVLRPIYTHLRDMIDKMWSFVPRSSPIIMANALEDLMISKEDLSALQQLQETFERSVSYRDIALLAATKAMTYKIETTRSNKRERNLLINHMAWRKKGAHNFAQSTVGGEDQSVLVELMSYDPEHKGLGHEDELYGRVEALAQLLHRSDYPKDFRILSSVGYYHVASHAAFALVYKFPQNAPPGSKPTSLKDVVKNFERPLLGALLRLAEMLTRCVLSFHKTQWLHKNISSWNVLFFRDELERSVAQMTALARSARMSPVASATPAKKDTKRPYPLLPFRRSSSRLGPENAPPLDIETPGRAPFSSSRPSLSSDFAIMEPYIVGFNHCRQDKKDAFTTGPSKDKNQAPYQHPDYKLGGTSIRFRPQFDYYSIGLVLLEIGMWQTLEDLASESLGSFPPTQLRDLWITKTVPRLGATMGAMYRDAVRLCLEDDFGGESRQSRARFRTGVIDPITKCVA